MKVNPFGMDGWTLRRWRVRLVHRLHRRLNACYWAGWTPTRIRHIRIWLFGRRLPHVPWGAIRRDTGPKWLGTNHSTRRTK